MDKEIKVIPYATSDGVPTFRDSEIKNIYNQIFDEGLAKYVFYEGDFGNAENFVHFVKQPTTYFHAVYYGDELGLVLWFHHPEYTHCYPHFTCFKWAMGTPLVYEFGRAIIDFLFRAYGFKVLVGITPTELCSHALPYIAKLGFTEVGEIPDVMYDMFTGNAIPAIISYVKREEYVNESNNESSDQD